MYKNDINFFFSLSFQQSDKRVILLYGHLCYNVIWVGGKQDSYKTVTIC